MRASLILAAAAALVTLAPAAHAAPTVYKFCGSDGPYGDVAEHVAQFRTDKVVIQPVDDTAGTRDNLARLLAPKTDPGACDATIGQQDGYLYLRQDPAFFGVKAADVAAVQRRVTFHSETVQIVCDGKLDLRNIYNARGSGKYTVALGPAGSGSWLWWKAAAAANPDYDKLQVSQAAGDDALSQVEEGLASCFVRVSGVPDPVIAKADKDYGKTLQMVEAYDNAFVTPKDDKGEPIYAWTTVKRAVYPTLLGWASYVNTVKEPAGGYVNTRKIAPEDMSAVVEAMKNASKYAKAAYGE